MKITNNLKEQSIITKISYVFLIGIILSIVSIFVVRAIELTGNPSALQGSEEGFTSVWAFVVAILAFLSTIFGFLPTYFLGLILDWRKQKLTYLQLAIGGLVILGILYYFYQRAFWV